MITLATFKIVADKHADLVRVTTKSHLICESISAQGKTFCFETIDIKTDIKLLFNQIYHLLHIKHKVIVMWKRHQ